MTRVQGLAQLQRRFDAIPKAVRDEVIAAFKKMGPLIVADMKQFAPKDEMKLVNSIGWTLGDAPEGAMVIGSVGGGKAYGALRLTIYAGDATTLVTVNQATGFQVQNAKLQEFGTVNMPANPYFYPVWRIWRRRARARVTAAMKRGIKKGKAA